MGLFVCIEFGEHARPGAIVRGTTPRRDPGGAADVGGHGVPNLRVVGCLLLQLEAECAYSSSSSGRRQVVV